MGYNSHKSLENTINIMGALLGVRPIVPWNHPPINQATIQANVHQGILMFHLQSFREKHVSFQAEVMFGTVKIINVITNTCLKANPSKWPYIF